MAMVAWSPNQSSAPMELIAVMVKPGKVTRRDWLEALSDRVSKMATEAPPGSVQEACAMMGLPTTDDPSEAGQYLVEGNLNLQTHLDLSMESEFPMQTGMPKLEAKQAIEETDLMTWAELASSMVSASSLG